MGTEAKLTELLKQCTVRIETGAKRGTGFFVAPNTVLTCAHVVSAAGTSVSIRTHDGRGPFSANVKRRITNEATQVPSDVSWPDLALLTTDIEDHESVLLLGDVEVHDPLYSFGYTDQYPNGDPITAESEDVSSAPLFLKFKEGQVRPGLSGAPILNLRTGGVCGIVKRSRQTESDLGGRGILTSTILENFPELVLEQAKVHRVRTTWTSRMTTSSQTALLEFTNREIGSQPVHSSLSLAIYQNLQKHINARDMYGAWKPSSASAAFIRVLAANRKFVYAGMDNGQGLYRSSDGGKSWHEATLGLPPSTSIAALVVAPQSGRLIASGRDAIWVSDDHGATWQRGHADVTGEIISIFLPPDEADLIVFGSRKQGGASVSAGTVAVLSASSGPATVPRTSWDGGHLHVRRGDHPWTTYALETINGMTCSTHDTRVVWIASADSGLYITRDSFDSVQVIESARRLRPLNVALPSDRGGVVAAATLKGLFLTFNDGETWTQVGEIGSVQVAGVLFVDGHADHALAATETGVYESRDGCQTWTPSFEGLDYRWSMSLLQWGSDILLATSGGGIYARGHGQRNWTVRGTGFPAASAVGIVHASSTLLACGLGVYRSMDSGTSWKRIGLVPQEVWCLTVLDDAVTAPAVLTPGLSVSRGGGASIATRGTPVRLLAGTDDTVHLYDGTSWTPLKTFEHARCLREVHVDGSSIYILAEGAGIFRSDDVGRTWRQLGADVIAYPATVGVLREAVLVATPEGVLFRSGDCGETWGAVSTIPVLAIGAAGDRAYLVSCDGSIACSTDRGRTFAIVANIELPLHRTWATFAVSPLDHEHVWLGTSSGAFRSTDGGRSWEAIAGGLLGDYHVNDLAITENAVYAAMAQGVFRFDLR